MMEEAQLNEMQIKKIACQFLSCNSISWQTYRNGSVLVSLFRQVNIMPDQNSFAILIEKYLYFA